ncbi:hypothetical protein HanPSC8_Chr10g0434581 [Helianthus annuus]|nr:hypothetical protein HanPSC8_Chr10g0434581 [Helianthus annuus]
MRAILGNSCAQTLNNASIDVEKIITSHTRLPRYTGRNNNNISTFQCLPQILITHVTNHLYLVLMWLTSAATPGVPAIS